MLPNEPAPLSAGRRERLDPAAQVHPHAGPLVYYLRNLAVPLGSPIKIGTTGNLPLRVEQLQRQTGEVLGLLAWEPGGYPVERARHERFARSRIAGSEWFWQSLDLLDHLAALGAAGIEDCLHTCPPDCPTRTEVRS